MIQLLRFDTETKAGLKSLTSLCVFSMMLVFLIAYVSPVIYVGDNYVAVLVIIAPLVAIIPAIMQIMIFSRDTLANGDPEKNKFVKAYQAVWPTRYLVEQYGLDESEAEYHWFNIFNTWADEKSPRRAQHAWTIRNGFHCRFVYVIMRTILFLLAFSLVLIPIFYFDNILRWNFNPLASSPYQELWYVRVIFIASLALGYLILRLSNHVSPQKLTGVWKKYADINENNISWLKKNIHSIEDLTNFIPNPVSKKGPATTFELGEYDLVVGLKKKGD